MHDWFSYKIHLAYHWLAGPVCPDPAQSIGWVLLMQRDISRLLRSISTAAPSSNVLCDSKNMGVTQRRVHGLLIKTWIQSSAGNCHYYAGGIPVAELCIIDLSRRCLHQLLNSGYSKLNPTLALWKEKTSRCVQSQPWHIILLKQ